MLTSPSNHVCKELELWKLVLEKYFLDVEYYVLRALGGDPYSTCSRREQRLKRTRTKVEKRVRVHSGEGGGAPFKNEKHVLVCFISCLHFSTL